MRGSAQTELAATNLADLLWPARPGLSQATAWRFVLLSLAGACLLTLAAKIQVPGPVPMTLQTLAVLALGALLGSRLALASMAVYLAQGAFGLPVFANTPPLTPGLGYLLGPTGGFLVGFVAAAAIVGLAADRGLVRRPALFAPVLAMASMLLLLCGWAWLAFGLPTASGAGLGAGRAFELGVKPFLLGEAVKVGLAAVALPILLEASARFVRR